MNALKFYYYLLESAGDCSGLGSDESGSITLCFGRGLEFSGFSMLPRFAASVLLPESPPDNVPSSPLLPFPPELTKLIKIWPYI